MILMSDFRFRRASSCSDRHYAVMQGWVSHFFCELRDNSLVALELALGFSVSDSKRSGRYWKWREE